jgi:hypothetical protein
MNANDPPSDLELVRRTNEGAVVHYVYITHDGHTGWASQADQAWVGVGDFIPALHYTFSHLYNIKLVLKALNKAQVTNIMCMNGRTIQGFVTIMSTMVAVGTDNTPAPIITPEPVPVP